MYPQLRMYIAGHWLNGGSAGERDVVNPATEEVLGRLPLAGAQELAASLEAAQSGFAVWSAMPPIERFHIMHRAAEILRAQTDEAARVMTLEQGKPLSESRREIQLSADIIDFLAEEGKRAYGRTIAPRSSAILQQHVTRVPVGPVLALTPWNFPMNLPSRKIAGALAAGCSCIIKPAETTPGSCQWLVAAFAEAGLPKGVLNLVYGDPGFVAETLIASPVIKKVSFTGSANVGKRLAARAAEGIKRVTLELGGHAPVVVANDTDARAVAAACAVAKFRNAGQVCVSPTRFLVQRGIFDRFLAEFVERSCKLKLGSGLGDVDMGPLAHRGRLAAMGSLVEAARSDGASIDTGGAPCQEIGYFFPPTVIVHPPLHTRLMSEEPFGPIAAVVRFDEMSDALDIANGLPFALAAYAFTENLDLAHMLGRKLRAGMVGINHFGVSQPETPFGGLDESGYGCESGSEGLLGYTDAKLVSFGQAMRV
jgi:succinate-semialdehyde dehydrogenase/glutarate-semialdehyde dehydrogenase